MTNEELIEFCKKSFGVFREMVLERDATEKEILAVLHDLMVNVISREIIRSNDPKSHLSKYLEILNISVHTSCLSVILSNDKTDNVH